MAEHLKTLSEEEQNDLKQYACLRKYEKMVSQFDEMMDMVDAITIPPKRRRMSSKKSTSAAGASNSASANKTTGQGTMTPPSVSASADDTTGKGSTNTAAAVEGEASKVAAAARREKFAALEQIITKHLNDLQSDDIWESAPKLD